MALPLKGAGAHVSLLRVQKQTHATFISIGELAHCIRRSSITDEPFVSSLKKLTLTPHTVGAESTASLYRKGFLKTQVPDNLKDARVCRAAVPK